jgi:hypothetical protein
MPIQNYSFYSFDAGLLISNALISLDITIYPPDIGCTWSLDVYPINDTDIPLTGRPIDSRFGLYDQIQGVNIQQSNVSTLDYWSDGTGKFLVGITGAWYGTADIGCQGYGLINICFSHP